MILDCQREKCMSEGDRFESGQPGRKRGTERVYGISADRKKSYPDNTIKNLPVVMRLGDTPVPIPNTMVKT